MATYDKKINIGFNRLLDRTALRENWLDFFDNKLAETVAAMFQGKSGTLHAQVISLGASANDTFDLDMTNARKVVVGSGNVVTLPTNANRVLKEHLQVPFENTSGQTYEVGIAYQQVADGIQINGRTGAPEYPRLREDMGEMGSPDSVTDNPGVSLTLRVNGLTQSSVDHSGRKVIVYLTTPVSGVEGTAYYEGTVAYNSPNNEVVIPYSGGNGPLGQDTSVNPPSTLTTDYVVFLPGASWKRGAATIYGDNDYAFIGRITGNGPGATPTSFDTTLQDPVFLITLQNAYEGLGSGGGRKIVANDGAVNIRSDDSNDDYSALLVLDRKGATEASAINQVSLIAKDNGLATLALASVTKGSECIEDNPGTSQSTTGLVNLTSGTVNLVNAGVDDEADLVLLSGFTTTAMNRLYAIQSFTSNSVTLYDLDASAMSYWSSGETGTVTFLRIRFALGAEEFVADETPGLTRGTIMNGLNYGLGPVLRIFPRGDDSSIDGYDRSTTPRLQFQLTRDGTIRLQTSGTPGNARNALLELLRNENVDYAQFGALAIEGDVSSVPFASFKPYNRGTEIHDNMTATLSGNTITLTDSGINLLGSNVRLSKYIMFVELFDCPNEADNGIYGFTAFTATTITAGARLETTGVVTFAGTSGRCRVLFPTFLVGGAGKFAGGYGYVDGQIVMTCRDVDGDYDNPIRIIPECYTANAHILELYNNRDPSTGAPLVASRIEVQADSSNWKDLHPKYVHGGDSGGNPILCGHEFNPHPGYNADNFAINIKPRPPRQLSGESLYNRAKAEFNYNGVELRRLEQCGRIARPHEFYDDFFRNQKGSIWKESQLNGVFYWGSATSTAGGILRLFANAGIGNYARAYVSDMMYLEHPSLSLYRIVNIAGRFRPSIAAGESPNHLNQDVGVYLYPTGNYKVGVRYRAAGSESQFEFFATDGTSTNTTIGKGAPGSDDGESGWFKFWMRLDLQSNSIVVSWDHEATANSNGIDAMNFPSPTSSSWRSMCDLYCYAENINNGSYPHAGEFDWVHIWDEVVQTGGKDRNS